MGCATSESGCCGKRSLQSLQGQLPLAVYPTLVLPQCDTLTQAGRCGAASLAGPAGAAPCASGAPAAASPAPCCRAGRIALLPGGSKMGGRGVRQGECWPEAAKNATHAYASEMTQMPNLPHAPTCPLTRSRASGRCCCRCSCSCPAGSDCLPCRGGRGARRGATPCQARHRRQGGQRLAIIRICRPCCLRGQQHAPPSLPIIPEALRGHLAAQMRRHSAAGRRRACGRHGRLRRGCLLSMHTGGSK